MQESHRVSASELQLYLKGVSYPADKMDLTSAARMNGAPQHIRDFISRLPEKQ
jgi:hypothetical protein